MDYLGDYLRGSTVRVPFSTFAGGASVTVSGLAVANIKVYKNFGTTERASTSGFSLPDTDGTDFDGRTGVHGFIIDTSDNADAGFFAAGNDYLIVVTDLTIGAQLTNLSCHFSIENRASAKLLGSPAGASVSADIAAAKTDTAAIKVKTDNLPDDPADASVIAGLIAALNNVSTADLTTAIETALATTPRDMPGKEAPDETPTMAYALMMLYKAWRNPTNQSGVLYELFDSAGVVVDQQATLVADTSHFEKAVIVEGT